MRAVVAAGYGGPNRVAIVDAPSPELGPRDVRIEVRAASLNPVDAKIREGELKPLLPLSKPIRLGCDVAGVVTEVGAGVTRFRAGDEVFSRLEKARMGGLAEQVCADESVVASKPARASFEEAASVPLVALTALQALREDLGLAAGQRVLVTAGAGGVGTMAIQIGKILGLHVATTTSTKNVAFVQGLGADEVIDYTKDKLRDHARDFDGALDGLGGASELDTIAVTKAGGVVVGIGGTPDVGFARRHMPGWTVPAIWFMELRRRRAAARAGVRFQFLFMRPDSAQLAEIAAWIDAGKLRPIIHKTYPLAQIADAFAELEAGKARGKIVVKIS